MRDHKKSVQSAIEKYIAKQTETAKPTNRKPNKSPEKDVEAECLKVMRGLGWDVAVFESKAVLIGNVWRNPGMKSGVCDVQGISDQGEPVFVELKAKGRRATFWKQGNERQVDYLLSKIERGAFAVVVDSSSDLINWFYLWRAARETGVARAREYLLSLLPPKPKARVDESDIF